MTCAAAARIAFAFVSAIVNRHGLVPDEANYVQLARVVASGRSADSWSPGYGQALYRSVWPFIAPITFVFRMIGVSRIAAQLWAVLWGVVAAVATLRLARDLLPTSAALGAGLIVALLPSQVLFSSIVLRESMVWAALVGLALAAGAVVRARAPDRSFVLSLIAVVLALMLLVDLRTQTAVAAALALVPTAILVPGPQRV